MSLSNQIGPEFRAFDFTYDQRTHEVFRGGSGPAVLVLHEIPGLHPGVIDFARRLIAAGYTVYLPSLFGRPAAPATGREVARTILHVCVAREFTKLANRTSPVVGWLRALAASAFGECGGPGVGVLGLRFTNDRGCPPERFETLRKTLGQSFEGIEIDSSPGNAAGIEPSAHSVLTISLVDEPGHPTRVALDRVLTFLAERLRG